MKLRTRLIISFCIIIFVPVMLTGITFWGFGQIQMKGIRQLYDGNTNPYELLLNSIRVLSHFTKADVEKLQKVAGEEPQKLEDLEYLAGINEELNEKYSFLVIRKGEEILYAGDQVTPESLPDFQEEEEGGSIGSYVDEDGKLLLKQIDFLYTDNTKGSMFIVTATEKLLPEIKGMVTDMLLSIILILVFTAGMLVVWIYKGIFNPIRKLQIAAENIKDGNLDFTIEPENDDEIGALCQSFEEMRKRLKDSTEEKISNEKENKVLISNISHDLKTPITAIKGYVEGIIDGVADTQEKMDRYIRTIYNKANEMDTLINELTLYSQIDTNRIPYNFNRIHVSDYFEDCVEELTLDLETKGIGLAYFNYADENIRIIADPEQLKRVINNIVGNSVKYLDKQKGFINIRVRDVGDFIQVEIEDNGKGIAAKDLPYIFDRFYRTDTSRNSATGGSGIGLSIVKKIIEDHGGSIWATSKEHTGTIMYFVMSKVLIIEDEVAIADLEKDYLELSGFNVEIENTGTVGLTRALTEEFDMFILDLMLPGIDGFDICKQIREAKNTPILMVSAKKDDIDKIRGLGLGADDYITKPFSPSELVARVKAHLARYERLIGSNMVENDIVEIRGLKIDKTARRVWVNGEERQFTTKEFDLLAFLAQNPNHVFTKEELFSKIWDLESVGDIATVTVHIKKIREKIEFNTAKPQYIETIWGVGYRFKV